MYCAKIVIQIAAYLKITASTYSNKEIRKKVKFPFYFILHLFCNKIYKIFALDKFVG